MYRLASLRMVSTRRTNILRTSFAGLVVPALLTACGASNQAGGGATTVPSAGTSQAAVPEVNPGGDIPDTQAYVAYTLPSGALTLKVPEGWAQSSHGGTVSFTSHYNSVSVTTMTATSAPTVASATALEVPAIQSKYTHVAVGTVSQVSRTAGQAILITYQADSPVDPVTGRFTRIAVERYEFWRSGTEAVIALAAPVGADNVDPWSTITNSFSWH